MSELDHGRPEIDDVEAAVRREKVPQLLPGNGATAIGRRVVGGSGRGRRQRLGECLFLGGRRLSCRAEAGDDGADIEDVDAAVSLGGLSGGHIE